MQHKQHITYNNASISPRITSKVMSIAKTMLKEHLIANGRYISQRMNIYASYLDGGVSKFEFTNYDTDEPVYTVSIRNKSMLKMEKVSEESYI